LEERGSEKPFFFDPGEDPILLSEEMDMDIVGEVPRIETEDENHQLTEEEEPLGVG